jgi:hypothetical protein
VPKRVAGLLTPDVYIFGARKVGFMYQFYTMHGTCNILLTFQSLAVSLLTTRFNIPKFYMVLALC